MLHVTCTIIYSSQNGVRIIRCSSLLTPVSTEEKVPPRHQGLSPFNTFLLISDVRAEKRPHEWLGGVLGVLGLAPSARTL